MALLQIAEPGGSPAPHERKLAVGIDLGTTNSLVATVRNGFPVVLPDERVITVAIHAGAKQVHITADGQVEGRYDSPVTFTIKKAPYSVKLVKRKERNYFHLLRTKLLWGRDLRREDLK